MAKAATKAPAKKSGEKSAKPAAKAKKAEAPKKAEKPAKVTVAKEAPAEVKATKPAEAKPSKEAAAKARKEAAQQKLDLAKLSEEEKKWVEIYEKHKGDKPQTYDMKATFEANKPLQHKILGWGWIMSNDNDRLEVLFKDGKRILISNYNR